MTHQKIPIYVINLDKSPGRLDYMNKQLTQLNLPFQRIDAVDGCQIDPEQLKEYQQQSKKSWLHYAQLTAGEIGCSLSWHQTWRHIKDNAHQSCVALEDDVQLGENFQTTVNALASSMDENIVIDLSGKKGFNLKERKIINGISLIRYQTPPLGNHGAIYGNNAIKIFLNKIQHFKAPVDTLQQMMWQHNVQTWSLEVGCLSHQTSAVGGSVINTQKKPILTKLKKELLRPLWRSAIVIRIFLYQN